MITNAVRHARADNLWLVLQHDGERVALNARDDGQGVKKVEWGNGLNGMAERLETLGGGLEIETKPGAGFRLQAWVPVESMT
jgi:signal transduction histidine kinase